MFTAFSMVRPAALAVCLCVSLAGCAAGDGTASPVGSPRTSTGVPAPATPVSGTPSPGSATDASGIPAGALLQPSDVHGAEQQPLEKGDFAYVRPLRPCGDKAYPSDDSRQDAVAVKYLVDPAERGDVPTVVTQFVGLHASGGAHAQFDDVVDGLRRCPGGLGEGQRRWTVLDRDVAGDESVLVRIDQRFSFGDDKPSVVGHYAAMARVNDVIVVVADLGWENLGGSEKLVRDLIGKAVQRAGSVD